MKRVLILAYDFPPYVSVGGLRPYNWYKNLKEFGIHPVVVTRDWGNCTGDSDDYILQSSIEKVCINESEFGTLISTPFKPNFANQLLLKFGDNRFRLLRRGITAFYEVAQYFFSVGPRREIYLAAKEYLKNNDVDVIVATGEPFVLFHYASKMSRKFSTPWIADYRDPWSQNKARQHSILYHKFLVWIEKKTVRNAQLITTASEHFIDLFKEYFPDKKISLISNGYDSDIFDRVKSVKQNDSIFTISLIGTIYKYHPWRSFLLTLDQILHDLPNVEVKLNFYGINIEDEMVKFIAGLSDQLKSSCQFFSKLDNATLLSKLAETNTLLLFNYYSFMGTKVYDYLAIKRKIIFCYEDDDQANVLKSQYYNLDTSNNNGKQVQRDLIIKTNSGIIVKDHLHLKVVLNELLAEFNAHGEIACHSKNIEQYSRKIQVEKLSRIIVELSES